MTKKRKKRYADVETPESDGQAISETRFELRLPVSLVSAMRQYANANEVSSSEAWRRAARAFLGIQNALPEDA